MMTATVIEYIDNSPLPTKEQHQNQLETIIIDTIDPKEGGKRLSK